MHKFAVLKRNVQKGDTISLVDFIFLRINQRGSTLLDIKNY